MVTKTLLGLSVVLVIAGASLAQDAEPSADEKAIRQTAVGYAKAFNARDAKAIAELWTPEGELVNEQGQEFRGRKAIEKEFAGIFAEHKNLAAEIVVNSVRFPAKDVAVESGTGWVRTTAGVPVSAARYVAIHVKQEGKWQIASVREMRYIPPSNYENLKDLNWLVGDWTAKADGKTIRIQCQWDANKNFLWRTYSVEEGDKKTKSGRQVVGWDPIAGQVRSWHFDDDGSFGQEYWTRDGDRWLGEASGLLRNGGQSRALNVLIRLDDNSFTWQSVRRTLNGAVLPDVPRVTLQRVATK